MRGNRQRLSGQRETHVDAGGVAIEQVDESSTVASYALKEERALFERLILDKQAVQKDALARLRATGEVVASHVGYMEQGHEEGIFANTVLGALDEAQQEVSNLSNAYA
eukprot:14159395-Heterocapsa_arctica.AAC.1